MKKNQVTRLQNLFRDAVESFAQAVYQADVSDFSLQDFDLVEAAIDIAIHAIEIHLLEHGQAVHAVHRRYYALIEKLRIAREGIIRGYPADPARRRGRDEIRSSAMQAFHEAFKVREQGRLRPPPSPKVRPSDRS